MALTDPKNTLAYHQSRVLVQHRNMGGVPCANVAKSIKGFMKADKNASQSPEKDALWFYGMNHATALICANRHPLEPLPADELEVIEAYHSEIVPRTVRAFYYLLLICIRESRHVGHNPNFKTVLKAQFGEAAVDFNTMINGTGSDGAYQSFLNNAPACDVGTLVRSLQHIFYKGQFGGGYGGPAWGKVSDCLVNFVDGTFSAEMMMDTIWTLCHNNGPIFNKGMMYGHYSEHIIRILDIQRSGQIPEAVLSDNYVMAYADPKLKEAMSWVQSRFPESIGKYVDWWTVEALGAVKQYPGEKVSQKVKYGPSAKATKAEQDAAIKHELAIKAAKQKAEADAKKFFTIMPGVKVEKIKIDRDAA